MYADTHEDMKVLNVRPESQEVRCVYMLHYSKNNYVTVTWLKIEDCVYYIIIDSSF